jgi:uncharacterized damage-inducible protein DinB
VVLSDWNAVIEELEATIERLRAAFAAANRVSGPRSEDGWSLADLLNHLRASDAIIASRVHQVLVRDGVPLPAFDERAWAATYMVTGIDPRTQLDQFALRRAEFVALLRTLVPDELRRAGHHEERGLMTVADLCRMLAEHEFDHRQQIAQWAG